MKNEYIAQYKVSNQISQYDFNVMHKTLKITDDTTMKEIRNWCKEDFTNSPIEVRLIQIQKDLDKKSEDDNLPF